MVSQSAQGGRLTRAVLFAIALILFLTGGLVVAARAQEVPPHAATDYPQTVDPWEIIIYEHSNFTGTWCSYRMQPGMRQRLVPQIYPGREDKVGSMKLGSNVKVAIFADYNFHAGAESDWTFFSQSISKVEIDYQVKSLILFPKAARSPLGVWLADERFSCGYCEVSFFPLPESENENESGWGFLGDFNLERNANDITVRDPVGKDSIEVVLYDQRDFGGNRKTFPGEDLGAWGESWGWINIGNFNWSDRAASLKVRWVGPKLGLGPSVPQKFEIQSGIDRPGFDYKTLNFKGANQCEQACASESKCKAFAWLKTAGNCYLKSSIPKPVTNSAIVSGVNAKDWAALSPEYRKPPVTSVFVTEAGIDRPGGDYKSFFIVSASAGVNECQKACAGDPNCKAFTWVKSATPGANAECWLKSSVNKPVHNAYCITGVDAQVKASLPPEYQNPPPAQNTKTVLASNANPSTEGQAVTLIATVTSNAGSPIGSVTFIYEGNDMIGTIPLDASGQAKLTTTGLAVGTHSITAIYNGTAGFNKSGSGAFSQTVNKAAATTTADISGTWHSSVGIDYVIAQTGGQFSWFLPAINETGKGTLNGPNLSVSWSGLAGNGSTTGKVTQVDAAGKATRIDWSNGAVFTKQASPVPSVIDISGLWHGSVGVDYVITQTGNQFTWLLGLINENGQGTLTGQNLSVSWSSPVSKGSATGNVTKVDANGKATRIDWSNGTFFYR